MLSVMMGGAENTMTNQFGETLRRLRIEKGLTQQQLATQLSMDRSSITSWETGRHMPDIPMITQIAAALGVDASALLESSKEPVAVPNVLLIDDQPIILQGGLPILREVMPNANVLGFSDPARALSFFEKNSVPLVFLDIELGTVNGLDLCREFLRFNPHTNVIYLTAFPEYSLNAWKTGASGFLLKPLDASEVRQELLRLRYPVRRLF